MKNIFKQIISDFHTKPLKNVKKRELKVPLNTGKIISIIWPRRAGKTYYLYWLINDLIKLWIDKTKIIFINFEDERIDISGKQLHIMVDAYLELYPDNRLDECYFFFDEIQNIVWWEKFVRRIYDEWIKNIFITGSNAKLLSKEIATSLRWRTLKYEILPLSFREFLNFKEEDINVYSTRGKAKVLNLQKEYLSWWGFPEIINYSEDLKLKTLQEYFDVMIYNDIIERYKIKNVIVLKEFVKQLIQSATKEYSINKIWNYLKSLWLKFDKNDLYQFIQYLETVYFSKSVSRFEYSLKKQVRKKVYFFDNGYLNALSFKFSNDYGKLLENMVFVELYRGYQDNIYFLKSWSETDFLVLEREKKIYQVTYQLTNENYEREIAWCVAGMEKFWLKEAYLITFEQEDDIQIGDKLIKVLPFYKWVL